jgi:hypothetical protein
MIEALRSSKTSVLTRATRRDISEVGILQGYFCSKYLPLSPFFSETVGFRVPVHIFEWFCSMSAPRLNIVLPPDVFQLLIIL